MDSTAAQWPQGIGVVKPIMDHHHHHHHQNTSGTGPNMMIERKPRPNKEQAVNCPRCNSTNTKFCYYNNYSLSQPRYFCKGCRRYWTEGGSLRNVPVGGGSRKNKRQSPSSSSSSSKKLHDQHHHHLLTPLNFPQSASQNPKIHQGQDLNLAYPPTSDYNTIPNFGLHHIQNPNPNSSSSPSSTAAAAAAAASNLSAMEFLKTGFATSRGLMSSLMPMTMPDGSSIYSSGFAMGEFKPSINFSMEGFEGNYGGLQGVHDDEESGERLFFPFEDLKQVSTTSDPLEENRGGGGGGQGGDSNSYWNGMLGTGGSW